MKLTPKVKAFCKEYVKNGENASAAYRHAYNAEKMKPETITKRSGEMLRDGAVKGLVNELREKAEKKIEKNFDISLEYIVNGFKSIADKTDAKDADRLKAFENLAKRIGFYEKDNEQKKADQTTKINFTRGS